MITTDVKYPLFLGGYGSGKSFIMILSAIIDAISIKNVNVYCYSPTFDQIRLNLYPRFQEQLDLLSIKYKTNKSEFSFTLQNKSIIFLRSLQIPERIIGYESYKSHIDELDVLDKNKAEDCFNRVVARTRQSVNNIRPGKVSIYSTPEGFSFLYDRWEKNKPSDDYKIIRSRTIDNPYMDQDYVNSLKATFTPNQLKAYLEGKFVNMQSGTVYDYFDRYKHHSDRLIKPDDVLHIGIDFNIGGCCGAVFVIDNNTPIMVKEFVSNDTFDIGMYIYKHFIENNHQVYVYPDASSKSRSTNAKQTDIQILRDHGIKRIIVGNQNPHITDRVNSVNTLLYNNRFLINTYNCPETTEALEQQSYNKNTGKPEKYNDHPSIDDRTDSVGYFIYSKFPVIRKKLYQSRKIKGV